MIADLIENNEKTPKRRIRPNKPRTIHTLMGDLRRFGASFEYGHYPLTKEDYLILKSYYKEKEGISDDGK